MKKQSENIEKENKDIFDCLRYDENGKFINENTEIIKDEKNKVATLINRYPDGHIDKVVIKLRDKKKS